MIKQLSIFFTLILFCAFSSCIEKEPRLSRTHNKIIDSLVTQQKTIIREELDSLCDIRFAKEIDKATDSIVQERMNEIKRKIEADAKKD